MQPPEPQKQHKWLQKLVGEWTYEMDGPTDATGSPTKLTGTETVRSLGDVWVVGEGDGEVPGGGRGRSMITLGYDPEKQRFVGSWVGSMMASFWAYEGELVAGERVLRLNSEGPSMTGDGKRALYQDVIELEGDDHRVRRRSPQIDLTSRSASGESIARGAP